jgi:ectoine hydroxylase-related dioxygenase (phytanoyl-CoA dioxygenase family)
LDNRLGHFEEHGWMRVSGGVSAADVEAMRHALWMVLADFGIDQAEPSTWTVERPAQLQRLRDHPAFRWRPTAALERTIETIVGTAFDRPKDLGSAFVAFRSTAPWGVPDKGWHIDANYRSPLFPAGGVKTLALLGEVKSRGGGTQVLDGSHRLVHDWFRLHPPPPTARSAELRKLLRAHPYVDTLLSPGEAEPRVERFLRSTEEHQGVTLQVVELTGSAGDVILMHPLLMHAPAPNNSEAPRLMVSGGVTTNLWGWAAA